MGTRLRGCDGEGYPFVLSLSKDERNGHRVRSWFDRLTTNGILGITTNGILGITTNGILGITTNN
jgi:hypothetical protein